MPNHLVPQLKRGKAEGRENFPRRNKYRVLYNLLITTKITCPRGEIGRHKGLKSLGIHKLHCLRQSQVVSKHYQS